VDAPAEQVDARTELVAFDPDHPTAVIGGGRAAD
jgi:hypothetical protein